MTTTDSNSAATTTACVAVASSIAAIAAGGMFYQKNKKNRASSSPSLPAVLQDATLSPKICQLLNPHLDQISGESLTKLIRQLNFWYSEDLEPEKLLELTTRLIDTATIITSSSSKNFKVPKVRFGRTEVQIPILTCGGMRLQKTWLPDNLPISVSQKSVLQHESQTQLLDLLRLCFKVGMTHFETARLYGTSEMQLANALHELMENGEIKRSDFILQTKIPFAATRKEWETLFEQSWAHFGDRFGYIDFVSFWVISKSMQIPTLLSDDADMPMAAALEYQKQGKIKHIGFSTHGPADVILKLINSNKFDYVNIHYHEFGSYHAEGTPDGLGGHGNAAAVKRALELDMGVFNISPLDKGGMLYAPTKTVARLIGPDMSPIAFGNLSSWKNGFHTVTIGLARESDIVESLQSAQFYADAPDYKTAVQTVQDRLHQHMVSTLGKEWTVKSLLNLPSFETKETNHVALGHIIWCYNLIKAFGMYDFARARYENLEERTSKWKPKKTFEENMKLVPGGNMGKSFDPDMDYTKLLKHHFDPESALTALKQAHEWLKKESTSVDREACQVAYDLRPWVAYPGETGLTAASVILQNYSFGLLGIKSGPTTASREFSTRLRDFIVSSNGN